MEYMTVRYSRKNDEFKVTVGMEKYLFPEDTWNQFLDAHGTNMKSSGKRLSGTDQVDVAAFKQLTEDYRK